MTDPDGQPPLERAGGQAGERQLDGQIAIIGMSCLFPAAPDLESFWRNILSGTDAIREPSHGEWDPAHYFDPSSKNFDRVYCKRGGFITENASFDPLKFGVMPNAVNGADPEQFLALKVAVQAVADAGYLERAFDRDRAEVILGRIGAPGAGAMNLIQHGQMIDQMLAVLATTCPEYSQDELAAIGDQLRGSLRPCNSDTIPGVMPNVLAGRIANRLGWRGRTLILDAACASSLLAVETGIRDLLSGQCDLVLSGGLHVNSSAFFYQMFCGIGALSHAQQIRPFDSKADGTLLGEGLGMVVLKRLADAERDGDRIYAVIRGIGTSSDGHGASVLAPSLEGEALALERAYAMAGVSARTVGLLEGHGTGTPVGDLVELRAIQKVFGAPNRGSAPWCALGSVKSMIGHTQAASGVAGLIKVALSLYERLLPPTLNVTQPNPDFDWARSACYINTQTRPWIQPWIHPDLRSRVQSDLLEQRREESAEAGCDAQESECLPRRAAVSAFGFGGVNAHVVLEEYLQADQTSQRSLHTVWDSELCIIAAESRGDLLDRLNRLERFFEQEQSLALKDVAYSLNQELEAADWGLRTWRLAIVASTVPDLLEKLRAGREQTLSGLKKNDDLGSAASSGIYLSQGMPGPGGKLAFLFPGLGAAYPHMLSDLCLHFPEVRAVFDFVDRLALMTGDPDPPSRKVFPPPVLPPGLDFASALTLATSESAVVMVLMAEWALFMLLGSLGIKPDAVMGCSTGEFAALATNGSGDIITAAPRFYELSAAVARSLPEDQTRELRSLRIAANFDELSELIRKDKGAVYLSADLGPAEAIISGPRADIEQTAARLKEAGIDFHRLPIAIPYHTPLLDAALNIDPEHTLDLPLKPPSLKSWSCSLAGPYPGDVRELRQVTTDLFKKPILLRQTIEAMYADGVRVFVEVGPKGSLSNLVREILRGRDHLSVASNLPTHSAITQIHHLLAVLACHGFSPRLGYLYKRRAPVLLDFNQEEPTNERKCTAMPLPLSYPAVQLQAPPERIRPHADQADGGWAIEARGGPVRQDGERVLSAQPADIDTEYATASGSRLAVAPGNFEPLSLSLPATEATTAVLNRTISPPSSCLSDRADDVMLSYLGTVNQFYSELMNTQEQVMLAFLESEGLAEPTPLSSSLAFLRDARIEMGDGGVEVWRRLTLAGDRYLLDHAIGGAVVTAGNEKERVYLLPLFVSLEIMVEAASLLCPGLVPIRIEQVRAYKRIRVDYAGFPIRLSARPKAGGNNVILVEIRTADASEDGCDDAAEQAVLACCEVTFAQHWLPVPEADCVVLAGERLPAIGETQLYGPETMFHGPRMQSVIRLERVGQRGIVGKVAVRQPVDWFAEDPLPAPDVPAFLIDPLLLDNASQLVLFHLFEQRLPVKALLPFHIECIQLFGWPDRSCAQVTVQAQLSTISDTTTQANVQIVDSEGRLLGRITDITSRRIITSPSWSAFITDPARRLIGQEVRQLTDLLQEPDRWTAVRVDGQAIADDRALLDWLADYVLSPAEREHFFTGLKSDHRKREWFLGRLAAKDAVRLLIRRVCGLELAPADVVISQQEGTQPSASGEWIGGTGWTPSLSIAHSQGVAVALAGRPGDESSAGIDLEPLRVLAAEFGDLAFSDGERRQIMALPSAQQDDWRLRIWCAKEALAKALGVGLGQIPQTIEVERLSDATGEMIVRYQKGDPSVRSRFLVPTTVDGEHVFALTACERPRD